PWHFSSSMVTRMFPSWAVGWRGGAPGPDDRGSPHGSRASSRGPAAVGGLQGWGASAMVSAVNAPLWAPTPERADSSAMSAFRAHVNERRRLALADSEAVTAWSIAEPDAFWTEVWNWGGVIGDPGS